MAHVVDNEACSCEFGPKTIDTIDKMVKAQGRRGSKGVEYIRTSNRIAAINKDCTLGKVYTGSAADMSLSDLPTKVNGVLPSTVMGARGIITTDKARDTFVGEVVRGDKTYTYGGENPWELNPVDMLHMAYHKPECYCKAYETSNSDGLQTVRDTNVLCWSPQRAQF
ncbi:MAG: hypothetical protein Q8R28_08390, partial [Dehalococcoidia bacterium]|nr:hypothetical protein [Dehalococcoidia bacterium]